MVPVILSVIFYAAIHSGQSCETVFKETAIQVNPEAAAEDELPYLEKLASAACRTTNPDIIWQIAYQESSFRFVIARDNSDGAGKVYRGSEAIKFLKKLKKNSLKNTAKSQNVDIGGLQFNWIWHKNGFNKDPLLMLSPVAQVDYFLEKFGESIYQRCLNKWVGCYHNATDQDRSSQYQTSVAKKGRILQLKALYFLQASLKDMDEQQRSQLPRIDREEYYKVLNNSRDMPLPEKELQDPKKFYEVHSLARQ